MKYLLLFLLTASLACAEDIITNNGTEYKNVENIKVSPDGLSWMTETGITKVKFKDLPVEVQKKYNYDPYEAALLDARGNSPVKLTLASAFRLSQIEEAKAKAIKENKPLGFVMVWDMFFKEPGNPMGPGSINAMAHFYQVFNDNLVLVFARHEDELGQVPESVKKGFFGPEEGGFAPNLCAVSPDASEYICEIPMGGANTPGTVREPIFREKIKVIKDYQAAHPAAPAP